MSEQSSASLDNLSGTAEVQPGVTGNVLKITEDGKIRIFENGSEELVSQ